MNLPIWIWKTIEFFVLIPAAIFCYLPMKNQLRFAWQHIVILLAGVFVLYTLAASWLIWYLNIDVNFILVPSLVIFFFIYYKTVTSDLSRTLAVYLNACALMTFPAVAAFIFDAYLHPSSGALNFSPEAGCFQLLLSFVLVLILAYPLRRYCSWMLQALNFPKVWYATLVLPATLLIFNFMMTPYSYKTLHTGRILMMFPFLEILLLFLLLFLYFLFYHMAAVILDHARQEEEVRFLSIQAGQYESLQNHIQQTRRLRHDFRHLVHGITALADDGDLKTLRTQLHEYSRELDINIPVNYCYNVALNALFNYYGELAASEQITTNWSIHIPEPLTISELDLCSLFGNLMENALAGCKTVPRPQRSFSLSIMPQNVNCLYIVSTNSFNGTVAKKGERYLSTKRNGDGLGLFSIKTIAEKYKGVAQMSNTDQEFCVNIMLRMQ